MALGTGRLQPASATPPAIRSAGAIDDLRTTKITKITKIDSWLSVSIFGRCAFQMIDDDLLDRHLPGIQFQPQLLDAAEDRAAAGRIWGGRSAARRRGPRAKRPRRKIHARRTHRV